MCLFINTLRTEVALRVWDMFFNEGSKVLFRIAIAVFKINETKLVESTDATTMFRTLRTMCEDITDPDLLISCAYSTHIYPQPGNLSGGSAGLKSFQSPTLKASKPGRAVPATLTGIGLAHLGPVLGSVSSERPVVPSSPSSIQRVSPLFVNLFVSVLMHHHHRSIWWNRLRRLGSRFLCCPDSTGIVNSREVILKRKEKSSGQSWKEDFE